MASARQVRKKKRKEKQKKEKRKRKKKLYWHLTPAPRGVGSPGRENSQESIQFEKSAPWHFFFGCRVPLQSH
jgi:hypothetical protein